MPETLEEKQKRYLELAHALQSGVAWEMNFNPKPTEPKHLRVGINMAMVEHSALVLLLAMKGILTVEEYYDIVISQMEAEIEQYEERIREHTGGNPNVHLH